MPTSTDFSTLPTWATGALQTGGATVPTAPTGPTRQTSGNTLLDNWNTLLNGMSGRTQMAELQASQNAQNSGTNVTGQAVGNNLAAAPDLSSLTNLINQLNIGAQQQANAARIPGSTGLEAQSSANIGSELSGVIPQDVITQLAQQSAERGVAMGSPGSDNSQSSLLRSLGLTSLDLQQLGQQNLTAADARNPVARLFDPTSQLITPAQQGSLNNQANQLALDWYSVLHPNVAGGRGGGGGQQQQQQPTAPDMSWFQRALTSAGGLNRPIGVQPVGLPPATPYDPNSVWDPNFIAGNPVMDTAAVDYSAPSFDTAGANYDPFAGYDFADLSGG